jgi:hypothetical protein
MSAMTLDQLAEEILKQIEKLTPEEKRECREHLRWSLYDSKLRKCIDTR